MVKPTKKAIQFSFIGVGLATAIVLSSSTNATAQTIPVLTNPCRGVGGFLTQIVDLLPFQLFDRSYDCDVNPPETDSLL